MCRLWRDLGRYYVKRGPVMWASFHRDACPSPDGNGRAVGITIDDSTIFGSESGRIGDEAIVSFSIGREIDNTRLDEGIDEMVEDARHVLQRLRLEEASDGDPLLIGSGMDSATAAEWESQDFGLCGVRIVFTVTF